MKLRFVEVEFEGIRWHIPQRDWWSSSLETPTKFDCFYPRLDCHFPAKDWSINKPGKPIEPVGAMEIVKLVFDHWRKEAIFIIEFHDETPKRLPYDFNLDEWIEKAFCITPSPSGTTPVV